MVRINSAHATLASATKIVENVRKVSKKIAILIDTKGPEIRTTKMASSGDGLKVVVGQRVIISDDPEHSSDQKSLYTNYPNLVNEVPIGARVLIDDGEISLTVIEKEAGQLICRAENEGIIKGRKSVNIPDVSINLPTLSPRDIEFIEWAIDCDLDFIAHSFVRNGEDVEEINTILRERESRIKVISKIENQEGLDNIDEILAASFGIMIARGDLGVEIEYQKIPIIQKQLLELCREKQKPVIVATQMLHTMIHNPRPTRAEVTDVANAILQGTDAVMLSGETAQGEYGVEAVKTIREIAIAAEEEVQPNLELHLKEVSHPVAAVLCRQLVSASETLPIKALVFDTRTGRTGRYISAFKPRKPLFAICYSAKVARELAISYGITAYLVEPRESKEQFTSASISLLLNEGHFKKEEIIGVVGGSYGRSAGATFIEICPAALMVKSAEGS